MNKATLNYLDQKKMIETLRNRKWSVIREEKNFNPQGGGELGKTVDLFKDGWIITVNKEGAAILSANQQGGQVARLMTLGYKPWTMEVVNWVEQNIDEATARVKAQEQSIKSAQIGKEIMSPVK